MPQSAAGGAAHPRPANDRSSLYEEITNKIIAEKERMERKNSKSWEAQTSMVLPSRSGLDYSNFVLWSGCSLCA